MRSSAGLPEGRRVCGIDWGKRRLGIALSDIMHITSRPYDTLFNSDNLIGELKTLADKEMVGLWVIGMPVGSNSQTSVLADIREFSQKLGEITGIDTIEMDESFSSQRAAARMAQSGMKKKKRAEKGMLDRFAAQLILQELLENHEIYL